jgi:uncharacterized protein with ACT and thioredoxin-like domain
MKLHIANFYDAPRHTAVAGEDIALGAVIKISANAAGERKALTVGDSDSAELVDGKWGVAAKVSVDQLQVSESLFGVPTEWGSRVVAIKSGDAIVQVAKGAIIEYDPSLLHTSLNPAASGALPVVGEALAIKGGKFCKANVSGAITSPVVGRVFDVLGGKVRIELV